jgi:hypothetical protein
MRALPILLLLGAVGLSACGNDVVVLRPSQTEVRFQNPPTEVDILLVVDDSCSMIEEQEAVGRGFEAFVEFFELADVDYHIAVTTTDMRDPDIVVPEEPDDPGGEQGRLVGSPPYITPDTPNAAESFADAVNVGAWQYAGIERGLDAAWAALGGPLADSVNSGFLREDALLSILFVSDEEDSSGYPVTHYVNRIRDLKGQRERDTVNAGALVGYNPETGEGEDCGGGLQGGGAVGGDRYVRFVELMGGEVASICEDDFTDIIARMGLMSSRLQQEFELSRRPQPDTIVIQLALDDEDTAGQDIPREGIDDGFYAWEYVEDEEDERYVVRFTDLAKLPPIGSRLNFTYELF